MRVEAGPFERIYDPSVGEAQPWYVNDHTFICDRDGTWHLIGITHPEPMDPFDETALCHATAPSLRGPWTKHAFAMTASEADGETQLWAPHVIEHGGRYWLFVCAGGPSGDRYRLHLAVSDDCWTWTRSPSNPLVVDGFEARDPMVLRLDEDRWVMYYTATSSPSGGNHVVAATFSSDLVTWSGRTIVYRDELVGTGAGPTESPFVVRGPDLRWYLFCGPARYGEAMARVAAGERPRWGSVYSSTVVLVSDDPLSFARADEVGMLEAHAAEVIVDPTDGSTWVSHCGWGQGGVYLAPLRWI